MQLKRLVDRNELVRLKRGLFIFSQESIDEFVVANLVYPQSYVSLESALNTFGVLPDIPAQVTSVTPLTPNTFTTPLGEFLYSKIDSRLYFGFQVTVNTDGLPIRIATPEKALLDYLYIRKIQTLEESRLDFTQLDRATLTHLSQPFPNWVKKLIL